MADEAVAVLDDEDWLRDRDDTEALDAVEDVRPADAAVLDAMAMVPAWQDGERLLVGVEHPVDAAIADRMHGDLVAGGVRLHHVVSNCSFGIIVSPRLSW